MSKAPKKNGLPYYKAYPRDFFEGTVGMPFEMKGAYRLVLDLVYMHGGNLPDDARYIAGLLGCTVRKWNSLRLSLLEEGKLFTVEGCLSNYRAVSELETLRKLQEKQAENRRGSSENKDLQKPRSDHTEPEPEPDKEELPNGSSKKAARGTRLPPDWVLPQDWGNWALEHGLAEHVIRLEAEKFRDHWISATGQSATKRDWLATWRNWIRRVPKQSAQQQPHSRSLGDERFDAAMRAADEWTAEQEAKRRGQPSPVDLGAYSDVVVALLPAERENGGGERGDEGLDFPPRPLASGRDW